MQATLRINQTRQRWFYSFLVLSLFVGIGGKSWGQTGTGNLIVEQIGDGTTTLSSDATIVKLLQYSPTGTLVSTSSTFGSTGTPTSSPYNLVESGSATSDGFLSLSVDKTFVVIPGYNAPDKANNIANSSPSTNGRTIGKLLSSGAIQANGTFNTLGSNNYRSVVSNGTGYWLAGQGGIAYTSTDVTTGIATTATTLNSANARVANIFNNTLCYSTSAAIFYLGTFGTLPISSSSSTTILTPPSSPSPYGFSFSPSGLICYVADDRASSSGGIQKWVYSGTFSATTGWSGGTWNLSYTLGTGASSIGARAITVDYSGTKPIIYATTAEGSLNRLISVTDGGSVGTSTISTLATAAAKFLFRGVAFAPAAPCTAPTLSTVADLNECANATTNNSLSVTATPSTGVTYQWYKNTTKSNTGGTVVTTGTGGTTATYTPLSTANGTFYYYVIASTGSTCNTTSNVATVTIGTTITLTSATGTNSQVVAPGGTIIPITYSIGNTGTGASISPTLPAGLTAVYSAGVYTISGTPTAVGAYNYTVTGTGGCSNNPTAGGTINVSCTTAPSTQASNITFSNVQTNSITASWTNGGGNGRLVYIQPGPSSSFPVPTGTPGTANTVYSGSGTQLVYNGTGNSVTVTGLTTGTEYFFRVYEYANCSGTYVYNTTTATNNPNSATAQATVIQTGFTSVLTPQYMPATSTANDRIPVMFRATVTGLTASTTYRYIVQGATSADFGGATTGAGNPLLVSSDGTSYTYVSNPPLNTLSTAGTYETFTTDGSGNYTGWFGFLNTGNVRFSVDSTIYPVIRICNNTTGSVLFQRALNATVKPLAFGTSAAATNGSFFQSVTSAIPKNLVALFDNTGASGRPLFISPVENLNVTPSTYYTGSNLITGYSQTNGAWNAIIPNVNANGVRAIEQLSVSNGSLVGCIATDADGVWPTGPVSTVNPTNGSAVKIINGNDDPLVLATFSTQPAPSTTYCQNDAASALSVSTSGSVSGLQWFSNTTNSYTGATLIVNATGFSYIPPTATPGTVYYFVQLTNSCGPVNSDFAKVVVNPTPVATFGAPTYKSCIGTPALITISGTTGAIVTYTINGGSAQQITLTGTSTTLNSESSPANTYNYLITGVSLNGCTGTSGSTTTVTINQKPDATISGNSFVVKGNNIQLTDVATIGGTWTKDNSNISFETSTTSNPVTVKGQSIGSTVVTYTTVADGNGCIGTANQTVTVLYDYITRAAGNFSNATTWNKGTVTGYTTATAAPAVSNDITVQHALTLDQDFGVGTGKSFAIITGGSMSISQNKVFSSAGTVDFGSKSVTVRSDATGTGAIGNVLTAIANATAVTVERYIPITLGGARTGRAWRMLAPSVTGTTIGAAWQENMLYDGMSFHTIGTSNTTTAPVGYGTMITGYTQGNATTANTNGYDFWTAIANSNSSIRRYQIASGAASGSWVSMSGINGMPLSNEPSYMLFVRGDRSVQTGAGATTLRATGTLNQTSKSITVDRTAGFAVGGNPFASNIDWFKVYQHNSTFVQDKFLVWSSKLGTYGAYVLVQGNTTGTYTVTPQNLGTTTPDNNARFIPSGAGFFVYPQTGTGTSTISIVEDDKAASSAVNPDPFRLSPETDRKLYVNLNQRDNDTSAVLADGVMARFDVTYDSIVNEDDAQKITNFNENLSILHSGNTDLMVEARPEIRKTDTLQLKLWNVTQRAYQLQMKGDNFASAVGVHAFLEDAYLQTKKEINLAGDITTVNFDVNSDAASYASDRFRIVFQNDAAVLPVTLTQVKAALATGGVAVSWMVTNETGVAAYTVERSVDGGRTYYAVAKQAAKNGGAAITNYTDLDAQPQKGDNLYRIRIESVNGQVSYSQVVKVTVGDVAGDIRITLYPNPVRKDGIVNMQIGGLKQGTYQLSIYSHKAQAVYQRKVTISQDNAGQTETLRLGSSLAQGSYEVRLTGKDGTIVFKDRILVGK